jgi:hypothetical protein
MTMSKETDRARDAREDREDKAAQAVQEKQDAKDDARDKELFQERTFGSHPPAHGATHATDGGTKAAADNELARAGHANRVVPGPDALPVDRRDEASSGPGVAPDRIARAVHEANRALGQAFGEDPGTPVQAAWIDAPQSQRDSVAADIKLALDTRDAPTPDQHTAWLDARLAQGWTKGPALDLEKKIHPHVAPFASLTLEQRAKILVTRAIVRALR